MEGDAGVGVGWWVCACEKAVAKLLTRERVCRVATVGEGGMPHVVPVCPVLPEGKVYFASGSDSRKVRNLKANPRLAVLVDLYRDLMSLREYRQKRLFDLTPGP